MNKKCIYLHSDTLRRLEQEIEKNKQNSSAEQEVLYVILFLSFWELRFLNQHDILVWLLHKDFTIWTEWSSQCNSFYFFINQFKGEQQRRIKSMEQEMEAKNSLLREAQ